MTSIPRSQPATPELFTEAPLLRACLDAAQVNLAVIDPTLRIIYLNDQGRAALAALGDLVHSTYGVAPHEVVGSSLLRYCNEPRKFEQLLRSPTALPHTQRTRLGPLTLVVHINTLAGDTPSGYVLTWEDVTEQITLSENEEELGRLAPMVKHTATCMILTDRDLRISYVNPAAVTTLRRLEANLPVRADQLVGQSIDIFHKRPEMQRRILADPRNLPHQAVIQLGAESMNLHVTAVYDPKGEYIGPMMSWDIVTDRVNAERREKAAAAHMRQILDKLRDSSHTLASASEQLSIVSQQMAQTASNTANQAGVVSSSSQQVSRNVQAVASAVEQLGASVKEIAKNTSDASRVATHAVSVAETTNATVAKLGDSSAEIGKVIKVITSIAQQTNLLALNATIEAARAGEAGKGFAVVANEVKELAKETAKATEDISQKIEAIQKDSRGAVAAITQISGIISQINDMQNTIASAVQEQTATTNEIGRNLTEAAKGSIEITNNITQVAEAAQSTTTGAADTQNAARSLSKIALEMQAIVSSADLRDEG